MSKNKTVRKAFMAKIGLVLYVFCFCAEGLFAAIADCSSIGTDNTARRGTLDGNCIVYYCQDGVVQKIASQNASACYDCALGDVKYTPYGSCDTCKQTCCDDYTWSECNQSCLGEPDPEPSENCTSTQCWDGTKCADKPGMGYNGKCYYTHFNCTCVDGAGWSCDKNFINTKVQRGTLDLSGWNSSAGISGLSECQPSTKSAFASGTSDVSADSLCSTQAHAVGVGGTGTWDGSCYILYYNNYAYSNFIAKLTCYAEEKVCE